MADERIEYIVETRFEGEDDLRQAANAIERVGQAGEHEMDDIATKIMVPRRNENLRARDGIALALRHRLGPQRGQVGAGLGFREVHGSGPSTRHHGGQVALHQGLRAVVAGHHAVGFRP